MGAHLCDTRVSDVTGCCQTPMLRGSTCQTAAVVSYSANGRRHCPVLARYARFLAAIHMVGNRIGARGLGNDGGIVGHAVVFFGAIKKMTRDEDLRHSLQSHIKEHLDAFEYPRIRKFLNSLPMSPLAKCSATDAPVTSGPIDRLHD